MPDRHSSELASVLYSRVETAEDQKLSIYEEFNLKWGDSDAVENQGRQGRLYDPKYAKKPGGIDIEDALFGMKMAHLAATDDGDNRLENVSPNFMQALEAIVEDPIEARKPLSTILKDHFKLEVDCLFDESGFIRGHAIDTQGFIAHNDDTIVLSYRFSVNFLDWVTNFTMSSSEWKPDVDETRGVPRCCNECQGIFTKYALGQKKPRAHTGYYNNFIVSIPYIRKHIMERLAHPDRRPTKIYVCGESLGAAIATCAFSFLLKEFPLEHPDQFPHRLICITAGSPRVCDNKMKQLIMERVDMLRPLNNCIFVRMVFNHDLVPCLPFNFMGYDHLDKLVFITPEGDIIINPRLRYTRGFGEVKKMFQQSYWMYDKNPTMEAITEGKYDGDEGGTKEEKIKTAFELECEATPGPIKDHMAIWYLTFCKEVKEKYATVEGRVSQIRHQSRRRRSSWFRHPSDILHSHHSQSTTSAEAESPLPNNLYCGGSSHLDPVSENISGENDFDASSLSSYIPEELNESADADSQNASPPPPPHKEVPEENADSQGASPPPNKEAPEESNGNADSHTTSLPLREEAKEEESSNSVEIVK